MHASHTENMSWIPDPEPDKRKVLENLNDIDNCLDVEEGEVESEHPTDSEQLEGKDKFENDYQENCLLGKDTTTIWNSCALRQNVSRRKHKIVTHLPEITNVAKHAKT
ncbi:hypothetical protein ILUMI_16902, partial [Ignelater luminosus]